MTARLPYESLKPGPIGDRVAVIDYDASNDCYYEPVDLDEPAILLGGGLEPRESDPRFHQQMVYAVVTETMRHFEQALGREVHWNGQRQLRIYPHAMHEANAFYSAELKALLFGYFPASDVDPGRNYPGQTIFTCLSHDIVAHETTHALVDGIRSYFMEPTNPDVAAFHEALADVVALFRHFSYRDALIDTIRRTGGDLYRASLGASQTAQPGGPTIQAEVPAYNPLVGLAQQFGEAMGMRRALRSALGTAPDPSAIQRTSEPHARGSILVAAIFDAYFSTYVRRSEDLFRIFRAGGGTTLGGDIPFELATRLADEASKTASHFFSMCVRALDYCPPVDITFGDFLRALITADIDLVPDDDLGYRDALMQAFRARGIRAEHAEFFSEDSLRWDPPDRSLRLGLDYNPLNWHRDHHNYFALVGAWVKDPENAAALQLDPKRPIEVASMHLLNRTGPDGDRRADIVVEFVQTSPHPIDPKDTGMGTFELRSGTTAIFQQSGNLRYLIYKRFTPTRIEQQQQYLSRLNPIHAGTTGLVSCAVGGNGHDCRLRINLAAMHRGY